MPPKSTRMAPPRLRSRICRASTGSAARLAASCAAVFSPLSAVAPPRSRSIAVSAGVGVTVIRAPPGKSHPGSARAATAPSISSSKARATGCTRAPSAGRSAATRAGSSTTTGADGCSAASRSTAPGPRRSSAGGPVPTSAASAASSRAVRRGPLPPCAARMTRTPEHGAFAEPLAALGIRQEPLALCQCHEAAADGAARAARTRPRCRSPTPSGAPGRQIA